MHSLKILREQGHLLIPLADRIALLDTGSPVSLATAPFEFLGEVHEVPAETLGLNLRSISELSGLSIDILLGADLLTRQNMRIRWRDEAIDFGDDIPSGKAAGPLSSLMGIPVFALELQGKGAAKAIFDTGAHLSYIDSALVADRPQFGTRDDFYPMVGHFTVPTYLVPTNIGGLSLEIEYGVLPVELQAMLGMAMVMSGTSAVVGTQILEFFDCTIFWDEGLIFWDDGTGRR